MDIELFLQYEKNDGILSDHLRMSLDRCVKLGWGGVVNTVVISKMKLMQYPPEPLPLSIEAQSIIKRSYGLYCMSDFSPFPQFTRLNLETDDVDEVQTLMRQIPTLKYTIISVTPLSDAVLKTICQSSDIDIISFDVSQYLPKSASSSIKTAVSRGIYIEFRYSQFIESSALRQSMISAALSIKHFTRGRNFIFGNGSNDPDLIRSPVDVKNLAYVLDFKNPSLTTNTNAKDVIAKGLARQCNAGVTRKITPKLVESESESDDIPIIIRQ